MLTAALIAAACSGQISQNEKDACIKALEAGSKQTGIERTINTKEKLYSTQIEKTVVPVTGEDFWIVVSTGVAASQNKELSYSFNPHLMKCDAVETKVGLSPDKASGLTLKWNF